MVFLYSTPRNKVYFQAKELLQLVCQIDECNAYGPIEFNQDINVAIMGMLIARIGSKDCHFAQSISLHPFRLMLL